MDQPRRFSSIDLNDPELVEGMKPPPRLYHYTDAAGFFGIVESGVSLRATHHRYMNDMGEVGFGLGIVGEVLDGLVGEIGEGVRRLVDEYLKDRIGEGSFIASLS